MNTKPLTTYVETSKELNISIKRYEHIISYVMQMIEDYRGNVADIVKEISLNLKGNERYFTMFVMGNSSSSMFSKANYKEKEEFITNIADALKISQEKAESIMYHIRDAVIKDTKKDVDIIKKVINSDFKDNEKDYMLFMLGLVYT